MVSAPGLSSTKILVRRPVIPLSLDRVRGYEGRANPLYQFGITDARDLMVHNRQDSFGIFHVFY